MSNLYVLECNGFHKVGISWDVKRRIRQLQTANPHEIRELCSGWCLDAGRWERWVHEAFEPVKVRGEWYVLPQRHLEILSLVIEHKGDWEKIKEKAGIKQVTTNAVSE